MDMGCYVDPDSGEALLQRGQHVNVEACMWPFRRMAGKFHVKCGVPYAATRTACMVLQPGDSNCCSMLVPMEMHSGSIPDLLMEENWQPDHGNVVRVIFVAGDGVHRRLFQE
jgi:hypothetical protein